MHPTDPDELSLVALCSTQGIGPATARRLLDEARARGVALERVLQLAPARLESDLGVPADAARAAGALTDPEALGAHAVRRARALGLSVLTILSPGYPERLRAALGDQAPPVLFVGGDAGLLQAPMAALVGSRRPSAAAARAVRVLGRELAGHGRVVVSGGARGVDAIAHRAALQTGATVVVPVLGLGRFEGVDDGPAQGRWCALGQFPLRAGWRSAHALMRNRTVAALADAVVAFDPRDCGGTWHTSVTALRMRRPIFIVCGRPEGARGRGLRRLVRMGATALDPAHMPGAAELADMETHFRPPPGTSQLSLFASPLP